MNPRKRKMVNEVYAMSEKERQEAAQESIIIKKGEKEMKDKLQTFADLVHSDTVDVVQKRYPGLNAEHEARISIRPGKKYTKVDIGRSGKYMVVIATGEIFGIKAYGVIHKGKRYGTLGTINDYYWGEYAPIKKLTA